MGELLEEIGNRSGIYGSWTSQVWSRQEIQEFCCVTNEIGFGRTELSLRLTALPSWCFIEWAWSRGLIPSRKRKTRFAIFTIFLHSSFENEVRNGSGEVGGGPYFVRMISYGPRRRWDRFWPKNSWKNKEEQKIPKLSFPFPPILPVFARFFRDHVEGHTY